MRKNIMALAALTAALALFSGLAACSSSPPKAAITTSVPTSYTDKNGYACDPAQAQSDGGLCPDDPAAPAASQPASPSAPPSPSASQPAPAPTMTRQTDKVVFKVRRQRLSLDSIRHRQRQQLTQGRVLGDGNVLPWSASLTYDSSALYYVVSAQLEGYGDIRDSVSEVVTTYCSDGSHHTESFPLASGHASGGYNIAQAEYAGGDTGNAHQAESDAGC